MRTYASVSVSNSVTPRQIASASVPTSLAVPACTASGRSVVWRITSTGFPRLGRLLLHATGVGQEQRGPIHQGNERQIGKRRD